MFTGLVHTTGVVRAIASKAQSKRLEIGFSGPADKLAATDLELGASVCVSGVCLTVTESSDQHFAADAAFETLAITTLGQLEVGDRVNLEPSLRVGDPLGGHLVSGHVDGIGRLVEVIERGEARECWFWIPPPLRRYVAVKGSIAVDGVSLTVNAIDDERFMVGLIPHTLAITTLGRLVEAGSGEVNLEVDLLARYVERIVSVGATHEGQERR